MEIRNLTLDRVFDIQRLQSRKGTPRRTRFSFESAGERHLDVVIEGWPNITPGMSVTVVLRIPGNWQSLAGWVNHADGEITGPSPEVSVFWVVAFSFLMPYVYLMGFGQGSAATGFSKYLLGAFLIVLPIAAVFSVNRAIQEQKALKALQAISTATKSICSGDGTDLG